MANDFSMDKEHQINVLVEDEVHILRAVDGANLRKTLLAAGISPYTAVTRVANCGGRGLCATCGVWIEAHEPSPVHWHDRLAARFGYPRLSCQIHITEAMTGSVQDVEHEVRERIRTLAPGGGYVLAPSNHLQADVPPENVVALYEAAHKHGGYPLKLAR